MELYKKIEDTSCRTPIIIPDEAQNNASATVARRESYKS